MWQPLRAKAVIRERFRSASSITQPAFISRTPKGIRSVIMSRTACWPGWPAHSTTACESSADRSGPLARSPPTIRPASSIMAKNMMVSVPLAQRIGVEGALDTMLLIAALRAE